MSGYLQYARRYSLESSTCFHLKLTDSRRNEKKQKKRKLFAHKWNSRMFNAYVEAQNEQNLYNADDRQLLFLFFILLSFASHLSHITRYSFAPHNERTHDWTANKKVSHISMRLLTVSHSAVYILCVSRRSVALYFLPEARWWRNWKRCCGAAKICSIPSHKKRRCWVSRLFLFWICTGATGENRSFANN